jgi:hypothetical protein
VAGIHGRMGQDHGGAVGRQGVVEAGASPELVDIAHVAEEDAAAVLDRPHHPEEVDVLRRRLSVVCPHADHVALVGRDVEQLVLPEEPRHRRVLLRALLAHLDGDGQMVFAEAEAQKQVGDGRTHPVHGDEVDPRRIVLETP